MTAAKRPPENATLGELKLDAEWSVVKKRETDPDTKAWPRLTIISKDQMKIAYKVDLAKRTFTAEFDTKRHGVWLYLADPAKVGPGAAKKINFKSRDANQARFDFNAMTGLFKGMGVERHNIAVEVWSYKDTHYWLFAPIGFVQSTEQYMGVRIIDEK